MRIIVNPASGRRVSLLKTLNDHLRPAGIYWDVAVTHEDGDGAAAARRAIEDGVDLVASYGGDGTLMDVCDGLAGTKMPLLVLAGGTGNLIAGELGVSKDIDKALSLVCADEFYRSRTVDVGTIGDRHFLLRIGCGVETNILQDASRELKNQFGKWAYAFAAVKALMEIQTADYRITLDDDHVIEGQGVACAVANAGSVGIGHLTLSPRIGINDGKLDLIFLRRADVEGIFELVRLMMGKEPGRKDELPEVPGGIDASHLINHWQVRKVRIETDPVLDIQADGNLLGQTPQTVEVMPGALTVVV